MTRYFCEHAWLGGPAVTASVTVTVDGGVIRGVTTGSRPVDAVTLAGVTVPGLANTHSHAFHRALRSRTQHGTGTFWTWRDQMYELAAALDPDRYYLLARATYGEMVLAGVTCVGEFHYLHHGPGGRPYGAVNAMGEALVAAASDAGIRITLLDTCYLEGGPGRPLEGVQARFGDGDAARWAERAAGAPVAPHVRRGAAIHSVRAVPPDQAAVVAAWAAARSVPLHAHLSEQPRENAEVSAAYGSSPTEVLDDAGALGPASTVVHGTHLTAGDRGRLAGTGTGVCLCPTTERDLADGVGPALLLARAGSPISLGSDSHAVIDLFEEARAMELDERIVSGIRNQWDPAELLVAATATGHAALGWPAAGRIAPGAPADLVAVGRGSVRLAGARSEDLLSAVVFAATAADVTDVVVSGRHIVRDGHHRTIDDVGAEMDAAVVPLGAG